MPKSDLIKALIGALHFFLFTGSGHAQQISSSSEETYIYLHSHPELSGFEINTSGFLKNELRELGFSIIDSLGIHSFAGVFTNGNGPVVMYRTDMDALPIVEQTGVPFAPGATVKSDTLIVGMHACGHDLHMTTWLGVAEYLIKNKKLWKGTAVFLAQSSEETGQGARAVLASENFKKLPVPDYQIAFHNTPELSCGTVGFCDGYSFAAVDMMNITIKGKGGHGAEPARTIDPILMAAYMVSELQSIVSRNLPSNDPAVVTVGAINGGTVGNIIPSQVELKLTIRSYSAESRSKILKRIEEIGNGIAISAGLDSSLFPEYKLLDMSIPSVYNNPELGKLLLDVMEENQIPTVSMPAKMIGEDFGVYGESRSIRSYMLWMGTSPVQEDSCPDPNNCEVLKLHTADYLPDYKAAIPLSANAMTKALISLFNNRPVPISKGVTPNLNDAKH
jgi:hippurate hydrolase